MKEKGVVGIVILVVVIVLGVGAGAFYLGKVSNQSKGSFVDKLSNQPSTQTAGDWAGSDKFGLCDGLSSDTVSDDLADIKAIGFGWARPRGDVLAQESVERNGNFDFSKSDEVITKLQDANVKIFGTLFPTGIPKVPQSINTQSFGNYVKQVVSHYRGKITYYQVGIEPFCEMQFEGELCYKNFYDLVKTAYDSAKSVDSTVMISPGGAAPVFDSKGGVARQVENMYGYFFSHGGSNYLDFFNFHYLVGAENPNVGKYVEYWKKLTNKDIWMSETGSRDVGDRYTISSNNSTEASWVKTHLETALQSGITRVFWCRAEHSFSDMPKVVEALQNFSKQNGGNPAGTVTERQTKQGGPSTGSGQG